MTTHNHDAVIAKLREAAAAGARLVPHLEQELTTANAKVEELSSQLAETHAGVANAERAIAVLEHDQEPAVAYVREFPDAITIEQLSKYWLYGAPSGRVVRIVSDTLAASVSALDRIARHLPDSAVSRRVRVNGHESLHLGDVHLHAETPADLWVYRNENPATALLLAVGIEQQDSIDAILKARDAGYRVMRLAINPADADANIAVQGADHA